MIKKSIFFLSLSFVFFTYISAQPDSWPYSFYNRVELFLYNLDGKIGSHYHIIKDNKINQLTYGSGKLLNADQIKKINELIHHPISGKILELSKCFIPRHAFVFFEKGKPLASIMIDFECEGMRFYPNIKTEPFQHEYTKKEIKSFEVLIQDYKNLVQELGLPVYKQPEDYKKRLEKDTVLNQCNTQTLQLIGKNAIKQLENPDGIRFDLSGLLRYNNIVYTVADKKWNHFIYKVDTFQRSFRISPAKELCPDTKIDFEGIDACNGNFYIIEEWYSNLLIGSKDSCSINKIPIKWEQLQIDRSKWGNRGLEGLAIDCKNQIVYLAKEREPRRIFRVDLKSGNISEPFKDLIQPENKLGYDISDMKFENGNLYILERGLGKITRINIATHTKLSYSFQEIVFHNGKRIFTNKHPKFGMAEGLILTKNQIWLGFDNNGDFVSDYGKSLGLNENNHTIIMIFKRPEGF